MNKLHIFRAAFALSLFCFAAPATAGPLDRDTSACAIAREAPTDANIEACTGEPVDLSGAVLSCEEERG